MSHLILFCVVWTDTQNNMQYKRERSILSLLEIFEQHVKQGSLLHYQNTDTLFLPPFLGKFQVLHQIRVVANTHILQFSLELKTNDCTSCP